MLPENFKILIADKDEFFRKSLQRSLKDRFFRVWLAENGNQVLNLCERVDFTLAIIDDPLPGILGVEVIRRLEMQYPQKYPKMKKILTSDFDIDPVIESALDYGILDRFLQKPLDVRDLLWEIEFLLGLSPEPFSHSNEGEEDFEDFALAEGALRETQLLLALPKN